MTHPLTPVIEEIETVKGAVKAPWFHKHADEWLRTLGEQVATDLQAVDCLARLDEKTDAIAQAKHSLCAVMGIDPKTDMAEVLKTAEITFRSFLQLEVAK